MNVSPINIIKLIKTSGRAGLLEIPTAIHILITVEHDNLIGCDKYEYNFSSIKI